MPRRRLNAAFFMAMRKGRPWVIVKAGVSADGMLRGRRVRDADHVAASLRRAQRLRAEVDAIAVGVETVLVDDPLLTVREVFRPRPLTRVDLRPAAAHAAVGPRCSQTLDAGPGRRAGDAADGERAAARAARSRRRAAWRPLMATRSKRASARTGRLGRAVGAGRGRAAAPCGAWEAGMIDEVQLFVAQRRFRPTGCRLRTAGLTLAALQRPAGRARRPDVLVRGYVHRPH